jgi:hypothetical protein
MPYVKQVNGNVICKMSYQQYFSIHASRFMSDKEVYAYSKGLRDHGYNVKAFETSA